LKWIERLAVLAGGRMKCRRSKEVWTERNGYSACMKGNNRRKERKKNERRLELKHRGINRKKKFAR
jgi:hypothetical protein